MCFFDRIERLLPREFGEKSEGVIFDKTKYDPLREIEIAKLKHSLKSLMRLGKESQFLKEYTAAEKKKEIRRIEQELEKLGANEKKQESNSKTYIL
jgi:hypothetical protein